MTVSPAVAKLARSTAAHVAFAAVAMGGWAAFANRGHGLAHEAIAGVVQGVLSGAITFFLKRSLEVMGAQLPIGLAPIVPPLVTCVVVLGVLVGAHRLAGTPEIGRTIALPYAVSSAYAWIYAFGLVMARRRAAA
jgi:fructose-specific phosphotransferase system IIC component